MWNNVKSPVCQIVFHNSLSLNLNWWVWSISESDAILLITFGYEDWNLTCILKTRWPYALHYRKLSSLLKEHPKLASWWFKFWELIAGCQPLSKTMFKLLPMLYQNIQGLEMQKSVNWALNLMAFMLSIGNRKFQGADLIPSYIFWTNPFFFLLKTGGIFLLNQNIYIPGMMLVLSLLRFCLFNFLFPPIAYV